RARVPGTGHHRADHMVADGKPAPYRRTGSSRYLFTGAGLGGSIRVSAAGGTAGSPGTRRRRPDLRGGAGESVAGTEGTPRDVFVEAVYSVITVPMIRSSSPCLR